MVVLCCTEGGHKMVKQGQNVKSCGGAKSLNTGLPMTFIVNTWQYRPLFRIQICVVLYAVSSGGSIPQQPRRYSAPTSPFSPPSPLVLLYSPPAAKWPPWNQLGDLGERWSPNRHRFWCRLFWEGKTHLTAIIIWIFVYWNLLNF